MFATKHILCSNIAVKNSFLPNIEVKNIPSEIDFIVQENDRVIPIEVKAEENVRARSLLQFIKDNPELKGLRISMKGYVDQNWMENIPLIAIRPYFDGMVELGNE